MNEKQPEVTEPNTLEEKSRRELHPSPSDVPGAASSTQTMSKPDPKPETPPPGIKPPGVPASPPSPTAPPKGR